MSTTDTQGAPSVPQLLRWLLPITRPVHPPLLASTAFRIINLSLDLALFATAAAGTMRLMGGGGGLTRLILALVVLSLLKAGAFYCEQFTGHYVAFKALELLRGHVFAQLWPKAPAIVTHSRSGDILTSLTRDVDRIEVVYAHTFAPVVSAYIVGIGAILVGGLTVGWGTISIAALCLLLSLFVVPYLGTRKAGRMSKEALAARRDLTHHVTDTLFGIDEVLGYGKAEQRREEMDDRGERVAELSAGPRDLRGVRRGLNVFLSLIATASIVVLGIETVSPVALAAVAVATLRVFEGPRGIEDAAGYLDQSLAALRRLWEMSHAPELVTDGPLEYADTAAPAVEFQSVTYAYPGPWQTGHDNRAATELDNAPRSEPILAVEDVSLHVPAGSHAILVGRSGSGKSTLVQLLQRYDDPSSGRVMIGGEPVSSFTLNSLRRAVVSVSQKNQLLQATIAHNLHLGTPNATEAEVWQALETAGLADEVRGMPEGLETSVGQRALTLSGGQVQRLCLARALLMDPRVLILDEFTSNLNLDLEVEIRERLRHALPNSTIIEVTHRLRATENADVVAVFDRGHLIASGSPKDITETSIADMFRTPVDSAR
ncbi:amino acid ABC transporter ATP-binding/permease protein [Flaviflexus massiliensis]|uniref:amino acid ABC transporter ATP-binding/permease protein n=1 Tax=Flaviflexus massiliensis TaxID=1522309 RepID=UPI0006D55EB7|nr:ABC transporter ATP-binding protein [Flaviflexus massiliensis]